jgi:hypothetical protein
MNFQLNDLPSVRGYLLQALKMDHTPEQLIQCLLVICQKLIELEEKDNK